MIVLSKEQILFLHSQLISETGGLDGIRDEGLLDSALSAPFQTFDGVDAFPSIQQKAARLGYGLVKNHAFIDENKRIGAHAMLVFLALNRIELDYNNRARKPLVLTVWMKAKKLFIPGWKGPCEKHAAHAIIRAYKVPGIGLLLRK